MTALPDYIQFKSFPGTPLKDIFTAASDDLLVLLAKLLEMDPLKRCTATEVRRLFAEVRIRSSTGIGLDTHLCKVQTPLTSRKTSFKILPLLEL